MKRPFAVIGFSMLVVSLLTLNINFKSAVALLIGATAVFCVFLIFRKLRKYQIMIFSAFAVVIYVVSHIFAQYGYYNAIIDFGKQTEIKGVVCQTPQETDYAYTYIIKLEDENYKIRYVSKDNRMFCEGDVVSGFVVAGDDSFNEDFFENSLSTKIYFTFFEDDKSYLETTGEIHDFYANIGKVKTWFSNIIDLYLPGESGAIAKAMTIGDKSEITDKTIDYFNYSGTSHLLVISGLHLTLWSIGLMRFAEKFSKLRKHTAPIGLLCLFTYSALTGFSVSVIRAGAMIGAVLLGKALRRDADSINSIGLALAFILTINPFAALSASLWFTVMSTLGILVFADKIILSINNWCKNKRFTKNSIVTTVITTTAISISTTIFTLPVFIVKFEMVPIVSFVSNLVMIDLALVLMVLTVVGAIFHATGILPLANGVFAITGTIGNFLKVFTKKIGLTQWSTLSVSHKYYEYFLAFALVCIAIAFIFKKHRKVMLKFIAVLLSSTFILLAVYCTTYDYFTPSIDVLFTDSTPVILANSRGTSVLVGTPKSKYIFNLKSILNSHNDKDFDGIIVTEKANVTPSYLINLYSNFNIENTFFCYQSPQIFECSSQSNINTVIVGGNITVNTENYTEYIEIFCKNKSLVLIDSEKTENVFENIKDYDIIILYGEDASDFKESIETENPDAHVVVSKEKQKLSIYFE